MKLNTIDLFAGCGGLSDGFEQSQKYNMLAAVEWDRNPIQALRKRLSTKWNIENVENKVLLFDMQRTEELFDGWDDTIFGKHDGLDKIINDKVDVIIGGPPCQAYSLAGRIRDTNGMKDDYRNYLFESYIKVVNQYKPKAVIFENVPGILSAKPGDGSFLIIDKIHEAFNDAGYEVLSDLSKAIIDMSDYGVPQVRKRIIILALNKQEYGSKCEEMLSDFYSVVLPKYKVLKKMTVRDAISDLPKLYPLEEDCYISGKHYSHNLPEPFVNGHVPRYHSRRDIKIFNLLANDIITGERKYASTEALKLLYEKETGHTSSVHKYHVCEWEKPSNLIPAHLYKDGLRHIHPDPLQARTITVREAARLQTFDDDFLFGDSMTAAFKMIGNAVPPLFAKKAALALADLLDGHKEG